jgi:hypothetical protein
MSNFTGKNTKLVKKWVGYGDDACIRRDFETGAKWYRLAVEVATSRRAEKSLEELVCERLMEILPAEFVRDGKRAVARAIQYSLYESLAYQVERWISFCEKNGWGSSPESERWSNWPAQW